MTMSKETQATRMFPHINTFIEARKWVEGLTDCHGNRSYTFEHEGNLYIVRRNGTCISAATDFVTALVGAQRIVRRNQAYALPFGKNSAR